MEKEIFWILPKKFKMYEKKVPNPSKDRLWFHISLRLCTLNRQPWVFSKLILRETPQNVQYVSKSDFSKKNLDIGSLQTSSHQHPKPKSTLYISNALNKHNNMADAKICQFILQYFNFSFLHPSPIFLALYCTQKNVDVSTYVNWEIIIFINIFMSQDL